MFGHHCSKEEEGIFLSKIPECDKDYIRTSIHFKKCFFRCLLYNISWLNLTAITNQFGWRAIFIISMVTFSFSVNAEFSKKFFKFSRLFPLFVYHWKIHGNAVWQFLSRWHIWGNRVWAFFYVCLGVINNL